MALNLVQHRGEPSVWDRADDRMEWDSERWLLGVMAGAFLVSGFRRRSWAGLMLVLGGSGLAWWAAAGADQRRLPPRAVARSLADAQEGRGSCRRGFPGVVPRERCAFVDADDRQHGPGLAEHPAAALGTAADGSAPHPSEGAAHVDESLQAHVQGGVLEG